eukprot:8582814-Pyramimonas_sp.AAC.1
MSGSSCPISGAAARARSRSPPPALMWRSRRRGGASRMRRRPRGSACRACASATSRWTDRRCGAWSRGARGAWRSPRC